MKRSEVLRLRTIIETAVQSLDDETALNAVMLHPEWACGVKYAAGFKVRYGGSLYSCLLEHTTQMDWIPDNAPSLWAKVLVEHGTISLWEQPGSTNAYSKGDKVMHKGSVWVSDVDSNVWEPGVYGWTEE